MIHGCHVVYVVMRPVSICGALNRELVIEDVVMYKVVLDFFVNYFEGVFTGQVGEWITPWTPDCEIRGATWLWLTFQCVSLSVR